MAKPHAHVMLTMREVVQREDGTAGFGAKVRDWNRTERVEQWRERWAEHVNQRLAELDIDALEVVANGVAEVRRDRPELGVLTITHYQRLLNHLRPDVVHILIDGRIVERGGVETAKRLDSEGYGSFR